MPSAKGLPPCPECQGRARDTRRPKSVQPLTADDLRGWEDYIERISSDGVRHTIDPIGLIGEYDLKERRNCSYFKHRHRRGILIEARCGDVLSLGLVCGRDVAGFSVVMRAVQQIRSLEAVREHQRSGEPLAIYERIASLTGQIERRLASIERIREVLPGLVTLMQRVASGSTSPYVHETVTRFDPVASIYRRVELQHDLRPGAKLFAGTHFLARAIEIRRQAKSYADEVPGMELDDDNYEKVQHERGALSDGERSLMQWLDDTAKFWIHENLDFATLRLFGSRTKVPNHVRVEGRTLVVRGVAIRIDGPKGATVTG